MHDVRRHIASCLKFMALTACFHSPGCGTGTQCQSDHQPFPNLQHDGRRLRGVAELPDGFHQREAMDRDDIRRRRTHQLYFQYHAENLQRNGQFIYWVDTGAEYTSGV